MRSCDSTCFREKRNWATGKARRKEMEKNRATYSARARIYIYVHRTVALLPNFATETRYLVEEMNQREREILFSGKRITKRSRNFFN